MAGHYPLNKTEESKLFSIVEQNIKDLLKYGKIVKDFTVIQLNDLNARKLSLEYVDDKKTDIAFSFGPVTLESITDEHPSLTQDISVEVHLDIDTEKIKNIYWVA